MASALAAPALAFASCVGEEEEYEKRGETQPGLVEWRHPWRNVMLRTLPSLLMLPVLAIAAPTPEDKVAPCVLSDKGRRHARI